MKTLVQPLKALERQVWESVSIDRLSTKASSSLNLKWEWGQSKTPHFQVKPNKQGRNQRRMDEGTRGSLRTAGKKTQFCQQGRKGGEMMPRRTTSRRWR